MFSRRSFVHSQSASSPDDVDVNSSSSSKAIRDREEVSYFNSTSTASSNIFRRGRNSMFVADETPCLLRERMPYHHLIAEKKGMNQTIEKRVPMSAQQRSVSQAAPVVHLRLMVISMMSTRQKNHAAETLDKWKAWHHPEALWREEITIKSTVTYHHSTKRSCCLILSSASS